MSRVSQLDALSRDIKLAHSVFALPFALLAMVLAAGWAQRRPSWTEAGLIVLCMFLARTFAMTVNRLVDARFDAKNPRTANRAIPDGRLTRQTATGVIVFCATGFVLSAACFGLAGANWWPAVLSPLVLTLLAFYSFTKRFTMLCHVVLGVALAASPLAAALAIEPGFLGVPTLWLLSAFVACWVAGFDVIYALADAEVDRELGLHAMPGRLGTGRALWISRALHAAAALLLLTCAASCELLGPYFSVASGVVVALLVVEHVLVWNSKQNRLNLAFFTVNGVISLLLGAAGVVDVWLKLQQ